MNRKDQILPYLRDGQEGREANRLEREALSDPFLYEALEGLTTVEGEHEEVVAKLEERISGCVSVKKKRIPVYWWAAASFLLIGGIALWLLRSPGEEVQMASVSPVADSLEVVQPVLELAKEEQTMPSVERKRNEVKVASVQSDEEVVEESNDMEVALMDEQTDRVVAAPVKAVRMVRGVVVDSTGQALPGVAVYYGKHGVATDVQGRFQMKLDDSAQRLRASYIGMRDQDFAVPDSGELRIKMFPDHTTLSEAVVTGKMEKRRTLLVGSATTVRAEEDWEATFYHYVADSLRYPADALSQKIKGEVVLSLNFNRKGKLGRIKIVQKLFPSCDQEAVRVVEAYPGPWDMKKGNVIVRIRFNPASGS